MFEIWDQWLPWKQYAENLRNLLAARGWSENSPWGCVCSCSKLCSAGGRTATEGTHAHVLWGAILSPVHTENCRKWLCLGHAFLWEVSRMNAFLFLSAQSCGKKRLWRDAQNNKTNRQRCESCALPEAAKHPLLIPLSKTLASQSPTCPVTGQHPGPQPSHAPTSYLAVLRIFVVEGLPAEADPWDTVGRSCVAVPGVRGPWRSNFHASCYLWESLWWHFPGALLRLQWVVVQGYPEPAIRVLTSDSSRKTFLPWITLIMSCNNVNWQPPCCLTLFLSYKHMMLLKITSLSLLRYYHLINLLLPLFLILLEIMNSLVIFSFPLVISSFVSFLRLTVLEF